MSFADSSLITTIINAVGLPTRVLIPVLADRIGPLNTIAPAALCVAIVAYTWVAVHDVAGVYIFSIFYGIASGAFQSLMPTGVASITTRLDTIGSKSHWGSYLGCAFEYTLRGAIGARESFEGWLEGKD
ncbi:hypothetical protein FOXYS1_14609 [Fusarium oxysporum]|uniref:Major facilitator superfamily (MFS) profile domain-containing protein n=2 Tax=Fusarium oxysporum TaxID=5507 RepID=A0A8H5EAS3_FUSOX|nr:hypothetical protein FOXYS1_14609 [Fusarium oxysporum]